MKTFSEKLEFIRFHLSNNRTFQESQISYPEKNNRTVDEYNIIFLINFNITNTPEENNTNSHYQKVKDVEEIISLLNNVANTPQEIDRKVNEFIQQNSIDLSKDLYLSLYY